jgi:hypothetical protein
MGTKRFLFIPLFFILFSGCSNTVKIKLYGNKSAGDNYGSIISPEGIVREVSHKYRILMPFPGMSGNFYFTFKAMAEGEARIIVYNRFRGRKPIPIAVYKAVVDKQKRLTLTPENTESIEFSLPFEDEDEEVNDEAE